MKTEREKDASESLEGKIKISVMTHDIVHYIKCLFLHCKGGRRGKRGEKQNK